MNQSARSWLMLMMIPFFIGVIVYFLVPLMMIVGANPKLEDTFNNYKIEVEQNSVRALAFLNSRVITNRLQMYRNILSTIKRLLALQHIDQIVNLSNVKLNSAYNIANADPTSRNTIEYNNSMWYSPNVTFQANMNEIQRGIFYAYVQASPFIMSMLANPTPIYSPIIKMWTTISYQNQQFYFQFPSQNCTKFQNTTAPILDSFYQNTIRNFQQSGLNMTVYDLGQEARICTVIFYGQFDRYNGVTCMDLDIDIVIKDILGTAKYQTSELSTNEYYYVRPLYYFEGLKNPQIIANFSSNNFSLINIPDFLYCDLESNKIPAEIFKADRLYYFHVQRQNRSKTYYTIPMSTLNINGVQEILLYLIVVNNFEKAQFAEQTRSDRIAVIMVVPAVVLLLVSMLATTLVFKSIFKKLDGALKMMENYCSLIKRSDLELEIPEYFESQDLSELFKELSKLNQLSKYADWQYFQVPKPQRIVRLLKCLKLFEVLRFNPTALFENICECYVYIGDNQNALRYLRLSIALTVKDIYGGSEGIHTAYQQKLNRSHRVDKAAKKKEKLLAKKIMRLCNILYSMHEGDQPELEQQITKNAELVRQITFPDILNFEYIFCLMFIINFEIKRGNFEKIQDQLKNLQELIQGYEEVNKHDQNCETSPDVMYSYWYLIKAKLLMAQRKFVEAYDYAVKSQKSNHFNPCVHNGAKMIIEKVLEIHKISKNELSKFQFLRQQRPRVKREYIFLIDVSKPGLDAREVSIWKKKARAAAEYILNTHVAEEDRVSITEFCVDIKIVCNLMERRSREKVLLKELLASMKAREQSIVASIIPCFRKSVERVSHLINEKIFLLFLKDGDEINLAQLGSEMRGIQNCQMLLFLENKSLLKNHSRQIFGLSYSNFEDIDRILQSKVIQQSDNISYIF